MPTIREMLHTMRLGRIADAVQATVKRSIVLTPAQRSTAPCSRLGGAPNLPPEFEWPLWQGSPLAFLAQFDLAALSPLEDLDLPREGALFFFYETGGGAWGFNP